MPGGFRGTGRNFRSSFLTPDRGWRTNPDYITPRSVNVCTYAPKKPDPEDDDDIPQEEETKKINSLQVKAIDYNIATNVKAHKTDMYVMTENAVEDGKEVPATLVIRRSQEFTVTLTFDREYNTDKDKLRLILNIGKSPVVSKGTQVYLVPDKILKPRHWSASVQSRNGDKLTVAILSPPNCIIGKWKIAVETWMDNGKAVNGKQERLKYDHEEPIYMIYNPFCKDDAVYMENEVDVDEYILNESGKIYSGCRKQVAAKPWVFGQFDNPVLECCVLLLDKMAEGGRLKIHNRGDPVAVTRAVSGIVNCQDDDGVLVGNWSGNYEGGTAPTHWLGSGPILDQFMKTGEPVCFGQCWVFSGVTTTVLRALGIPGRSVTNFSSAHDCDGSMTIDLHWDETGSLIPERNEDSVWNFHVWNEAWMVRPDLETGYGGWQALDATPQETSGGYFCAGPVSLRAIKEGNVNYPFDGRFIFAEVNADKVHWILQKDGDWKKVIQKNAVGKKISTKRPRKAPTDVRDKYKLALHDDRDRLDITDLYKFTEGTETERAAVYKANTYSSRMDIYDRGKEDVKFELNQRDDILVGNSFDVRVHAQNLSRSVRTVHATISIKAMHYTGVAVRNGKIKTQVFDVELHAIRAEELVMRVQAEEYLHLVVDQAAFEISVLAHVEETKQVFAECDDFRLRRPDLEIEISQKAKVGKPVDAIIKFANSMPVHLCNCEWMIEGPGLQQAKRIKEKNLEPYDRVEIKLSLTPVKVGERHLLASFHSKELMDVTGSAVIQVEE